jgi:hypothetical protein
MKTNATISDFALSPDGWPNAAWLCYNRINVSKWRPNTRQPARAMIINGT